MQGIGGFYYVREDETGEIITLRAQRKLRRERMKPKIGDRVEIQPGVGEEDGWILQILPRRNELDRPPVANIDRIVLTASAAVPEADLMLMDRMLITARRRNICPVLVITKAELDGEACERIAEQYRDAGIDVYPVSAVTGMGIDRLKEALRGTVHALAGQSGAGKSTLINKLYRLEQETGELSEKIDRGKNTTRSCQLIEVGENTMVLDTPGFSLLEQEPFDPVELQDSYPEFAESTGKCYFQPCYHASEPKCDVRRRVDEGLIDAERHERYKQLLDEMKIKWRERYD